MLWLLLLGMFFWVYRPPVDLGWSVVRAEMLDAQVITRHVSLRTNQQADEWLVQLAFSYVWQGQEYLSHDLVTLPHELAQAGDLTRQEYEFWIHRRKSSAWQQTQVWVNPKQPRQATLILNPNDPKWRALFCVGCYSHFSRAD